MAAPFISRRCVRWLAAVGLTAALAACAAMQSGVVRVAADDPAISAAQSRARASLDGFLARWQAPRAGDSDFAVKVAMPTDPQPGLEVIWVMLLVQEGDFFGGRYANQPVRIAGKRRGDPVQFTRDQIADWQYTANGRIHGAFTTRVLLPRMDSATQAEVRRTLAPLP